MNPDISKKLDEVKNYFLDQGIRVDINRTRNVVTCEYWYEFRVTSVVSYVYEIVALREDIVEKARPQDLVQVIKSRLCSLVEGQVEPDVNLLLAI